MQRDLNCTGATEHLDSRVVGKNFNVGAPEQQHRPPVCHCLRAEAKLSVEELVAPSRHLLGFSGNYRCSVTSSALAGLLQLCIWASAPTEQCQDMRCRVSARVH
jgi:hypothetical protein